jgi:DNA-directed RNA polymerase specialized sigma subunit
MSNWITAKIDYALMELITKHKRENRWASMHYCSPIADEEEGASLLDVGAKEDDCDNRIDLSYIWRLMESELTHRENIVVRMYYRDGLIHREIAEKFGFDYQQILRMCLCSLDKLRVAIKLKYPQIEEYYGKNAMDAYTGNQTGRIDYYTQSQRDSG